MHPQKRTMAWIVAVGGAAVLASYAYSLDLDPATQAALWGGVPAALLPAYLTAMVSATSNGERFEPETQKPDPAA